jgi:hypothetical protein
MNALMTIVPKIIEAYRSALFLFLLPITSSGVKNFDIVHSPLIIDSSWLTLSLDRGPYSFA